MKPGYKTTEFWITVVAAVVGLLATSGAMPTGGTAGQVFGFAQTTLVTLGYAIARGLAKKG